MNRTKDSGYVLITQSVHHIQVIFLSLKLDQDIALLDNAQEGDIENIQNVAFELPFSMAERCQS